jgi:hypothetical protein
MLLKDDVFPVSCSLPLHKHVIKRNEKIGETRLTTKR